MFRTALVAAFVATASAAAWPMITVNSAGEIVLNSPTKAGSFQLNAVTVTSAPTSSGTASRSTVTALDADTDAFIVNVPSSPATSAGYKLPTATEGRTIQFYNSGSGKGAFTIWTSSTSVFIDGTSATTVDILSTTSLVTAVATSSTNWVISKKAAASALNSKGFLTASTATAAATMSTADIMGGFYTITPTAAVALTIPTASSLTAADTDSTNGDSYEFQVYNAGSIAAATDLTVTLTAGTGITVPSDNTQLIIPGQRRNYIAYRTSSSAWTVIQKSSFLVHPSTATANGNAYTANQTPTSHSTRFTETSFTVTGKVTEVTLTYVNNYAKLGDTCTYGLGTSQATENAAVYCAVNADNQLFVSGLSSTSVGGAVHTLPFVTLVKSG